MIALQKEEAPEILASNWERWTEILTEKSAQGVEPTKAELSRYAHPDIKAALIKETSGKCAYCESRIRHISPGDVEHISPKSLTPGHRFQWENLTLACSTCNTNKGAEAISRDNFIDPYSEDPEQAFLWFGPAISGRPGPRCDAAEYAVVLMKLNRDELLSRRQERIENLKRHLDLVHRKPEPLRQLLLEDFQNDLSSDSEYAGLSRAYAKAATLA